MRGVERAEKKRLLTMVKKRFFIRGVLVLLFWMRCFKSTVNVFRHCFKTVSKIDVARIASKSRIIASNLTVFERISVGIGWVLHKVNKLFNVN